jgi:septation ring formation regulator EzrA
MFTSQHELDALRAQLELNFIKQRLEASEHDKEQLKKEVTELKAELKKSRADVNEVWRKFTETLADFAKPQKKRSPFVLTKDMRVYGDDDEITNLFTD